MKQIILSLFIFLTILSAQDTQTKTVKIAFGFDKQPFIFGKDMFKGIEADIIKEAFAISGYKVKDIRMTKDNLETAIYKYDDIDGVSTISPNDKKLYYSDDFTVYENYAISRKSENIKLDSIDDLKNINFIAWKNSYNDLGDKFYKLYNPKDGIYKESYHESMIQKEDVKRFFSGQVDVILIDKTIFNWHKNLYKNKKEYTFHKIFTYNKIYPVTFKSKEIRDIFNIGLRKLKKSGRYLEIIEFYQKDKIVKLKNYLDILADISSKYLYMNDYKKLDFVLKQYFKNTAILSVSINNLEKDIFKVSIDNNDSSSSFFEKDIFYEDGQNIIKVGTIKVEYSNNISKNKINIDNLIPNISNINSLNRNDLLYIKKVYKKYNIVCLDTLGLTKQEKEYIRKHKIITVHNESSWAPYNFIEKGTAKGFSIDYMNLLALKLGIKIKYIQGYSWHEFLKQIEEEKIDVLLNISPSLKREEYINFTTPIIDSKKAIFSNQRHFNAIKDLENKIVAVPEGFYISGYLENNYPKIKLKKYKNTFECILAVIKNEADAMIENYAAVNYLIRQNGLSIKYVSITQEDRLTAHLALGVRKSQVILRDILQKAQNSVTQKQLDILKNMWFGLNNKLNTTSLYKSKEDNIKYEKVIRACVGPSWMPFENINKNGEYIGIISEYNKLISKKADLTFEFKYMKTFKQSIDDVLNNKCDIIMAAVANPKMKKKLLFTKPYYVAPRAYVTHKDTPWVSDFSYLLKHNKRVGVVENTPASIILKNMYKNNIEIISYKNTQEGLKAVSSKEIISFVNIMPTIAYSIQNNLFTDIKIAGYINKNIPLSIAVNKNNTKLVPILNRAINSITPQEKLEIFDKWISIKFESKVNYIYLEIAIGIFIVILLIGIYINHLLKKRIKKEVQKNRDNEKLIIQQSRLAQMGEMISMIAHQWRQPLNNLSVLNQTVVLKYKRNKLDDKIIDYFQTNSNKQIQNMSKTIDDFRDFFKPEKEKVNFCINDIISNTIEMVEPVFVTNEISINFENVEILNTIGYPNELGQVILNIINNSKDALLEKKIEKKKIDILLFKQNQDIIILIKDNANGIPSNIIDNIFDPYFSTKIEKDGTGLGLYMSKMIIEDHCDGKITASNDKDGAVFRIMLKEYNV